VGRPIGYGAPSHRRAAPIHRRANLAGRPPGGHVNRRRSTQREHLDLRPRQRDADAADGPGWRA
jgi:hypothetical protein